LGLNAANYLEQQFGTPVLSTTPIGVQPTLRWLEELREAINASAVRQGRDVSIAMPSLTAFSLDGESAPSAVPWFARTADMDSYSNKPVFIFGDATHTVGVTRFVADELGMPVAGAGTYLHHEAEWVREQLRGYVSDEQFLVTDEFQQVAARIAELRPELVCGTQMERHTARKYDLNCMVIAPPTHIEDHLLSYKPFLGFDGADVIADIISTTCTLGLEKHLIDLFGDAGLDDVPEPEPVAAAVAQPAAPPAEPVAVAAVSDLPAGDVAPAWLPDAEAMLKKIPFFVRGRVRTNVERYAREHGHAQIDAEVLLTAKEQFGA
jgi:light-independent protochlorophyllide reductase subunit B